MIVEPPMIVAWVWFYPAVNKKQMKSDLGFTGRKSQIDSTLPCSLSGHRCRWVNLSITSSFAHTSAHSEQKHIWTAVNDIYIPLATKVSVVCVYVFICNCPGVFTFITEVKLGQVVSLVCLFIHSSVLPLLVCAQIHGFVVHFVLSEKGTDVCKIKHHQVVLHLPPNIWLVDKSE